MSVNGALLGRIHHNTHELNIYNVGGTKAKSIDVSFAKYFAVIDRYIRLCFCYFNKKNVTYSLAVSILIGH